MNSSLNSGVLWTRKTQKSYGGKTLHDFDFWRLTRRWFGNLPYRIHSWELKYTWLLKTLEVQNQKPVNKQTAFPFRLCSIYSTSGMSSLNPTTSATRSASMNNSDRTQLCSQWVRSRSLGAESDNADDTLTLKEQRIALYLLEEATVGVDTRQGDRERTRLCHWTHSRRRL
jgi:hypothetical protein